MRLSRFNLYIDDYPSPGSTLVHNTFTGAYVVVDQVTLAALREQVTLTALREQVTLAASREADRGEPSRGEECTVLDLAELADPDVGVVVTSHEEEERAYRDWYEWRRSRRTLQSIVGINLACNFDCPYCCQAGIMDGSVMRQEIVEETADWLAGRACAIDAESAHVVFVGGEPLLHPDRIKALAARLRARLEPLGIELTLGIITNGYFLTEEMACELRSYGLTIAGVTLDGDETTHHLTRVSKKGENTFDRIFGNVIAASRHIRVSVNGNFQDNTVAGFAPLIDKLAAAGLPAGSKISFSPALALLEAPGGSGSSTCTWGSAAAGHRVAFHDRILEHGFTTPALGVVGPCGFHDRHLYVVDHLGNLFKCPGFFGHAEWSIGHVSTGLSDRYEQLLAVSSDQRCSSCAHQPNCVGGCLAHEFLRSKATGGVNCELDYLEEVKRDALVRSYLLASHDDVKDAVAKFPPSAMDPARPIPDSDPSASRGKKRVPGLRVL